MEHNISKDLVRFWWKLRDTELPKQDPKDNGRFSVMMFYFRNQLYLKYPTHELNISVFSILPRILTAWAWRRILARMSEGSSSAVFMAISLAMNLWSVPFGAFSRPSWPATSEFIGPSGACYFAGFIEKVPQKADKDRISRKLEKNRTLGHRKVRWLSF